MPITKLSFSNVGPFDDIEFEFDPQVNVFTGPNNSGKSTALWVLGELLVYPFTMPRKLLRPETPKWSLNLASLTGIDTVSGSLPAEIDTLLGVFERVGYTSYVPAQRHSTNFRSLGPTAGDDTEARLEEVLEQFFTDAPAHLRERGVGAVRQAWLPSAGHPEPPELSQRRKLMVTGNSLVSDEAVIQEIINLEFRSYFRNESALRDIIVQVGEMASEITNGFVIQYSGIGEDDVGVYPEFSTVDGLMPLNTLSQGTQSVIQWLARLIIGYATYYEYPKTLEDKPGVLIIDEVDAHLHPSWQRRIIPTLTDFFPNLQIFCSTHSPLMLAGLKAGQVQLLQRDETTKEVTVSRNEDDIIAWSADEILRNFLGVRDPTDWETVKDLERLRELQGKQELSSEESKELESLSEAVSADLLSGPVAAQVDRFIQALEQAKADGDL